MIANNAFMIDEMKEKVRKETEKKIRKSEEELIKREKTQTVKNAIKLGISDEDISKLTDLKVKEVTKIRNSI